MPSSDVLMAACQAVDAWAPLVTHPGLVALRAAFVSADLDGSNALFLAYDYHPGERRAGGAGLVLVWCCYGAAVIGAAHTSFVPI